jgi:serine/threonine protein kinase
MPSLSSITWIVAWLLATSVNSAYGKVHIKNSTRNSHVELLHATSSYSSGFLSAYREMISSLLLGKDMPIDRELLRKKHEKRTSSSLRGKFRNHIGDCSELGPLKTVRVLQDDYDTYVRLVVDRNGRYLVEKDVSKVKYYESEVDFFNHAPPDSRYFSKLVCHGASVRRPGVYRLVMEHIDARESEIMAARATPAQFQYMVAQLFQAVVELHDLGYLHADIKPGNILVDDNFRLYLIDFGMVTPVEEGRKYRGNPHIRSPELESQTPGPVNEGIDWWATGATISIWYYYLLHEIATASGDDRPLRPYELSKKAKAMGSSVRLFGSHIPKQLISALGYDFTPMKWTSGRFRPGLFPAAIPEALRSFLTLFLTVDSELRVFNTERLQNMVRTHPYLQGIDWSAL